MTKEDYECIMECRAKLELIERHKAHVVQHLRDKRLDAGLKRKLLEMMEDLSRMTASITQHMEMHEQGLVGRDDLKPGEISVNAVELSDRPN